MGYDDAVASRHEAQLADIKPIEKTGLTSDHTRRSTHTHILPFPQQQPNNASRGFRKAQKAPHSKWPSHRSLEYVYTSANGVMARRKFAAGLALILDLGVGLGSGFIMANWYCHNKGLSVLEGQTERECGMDEFLADV
ncbi:hypothetical protein Trco_001012 [Trichoderma cornu-damae]|uniref:Uncharacterized protein n=1 Tax=Trichoderma cornu-damae TaxID=654480 RepID=A0A9P8QYF8_9HYPO|nr:hypothetical protein Trco_001012 [Trichoderma cornu-damae]